MCCLLFVVLVVSCLACVCVRGMVIGGLCWLACGCCLMVVACCMLFVVSCVVCVVSWLVCVVCCVLFGVRCCCLLCFVVC